MKLIFKSMRPVPLILIATLLYLFFLKGINLTLLSATFLIVFGIRIVSYDNLIKEFIPNKTIFLLLLPYLFIRIFNPIICFMTILTILSFSKQYFKSFLYINLVFYQSILIGLKIPVAAIIEVVILIIIFNCYKKINNITRYILLSLASIVTLIMIYQISFLCQKYNLYLFNTKLQTIFLLLMMSYIVILVIASYKYYLKKQ